MNVGVEAADKSFVAGAQTRNDGIEALRHLASVFPVQIVVNEQHQGQRKRVRAESNDPLFDVVFENAEFVLAQVRDEAPGAVLHRDGNNHLIHLDA